MALLRLIVPPWPTPSEATSSNCQAGSFRVHVYAGTDPVTRRARRLRETCPDEATAAATLGRLLNEREADDDIAAERGTVHQSAEDMFTHLDSLGSADE